MSDDDVFHTLLRVLVFVLFCCVIFVLGLVVAGALLLSAVAR